ncbi:MAG: AAA family ATPase [Candidatus Brocadiia bacterium]
MLTRFHVEGFKSLADIDLGLPRMLVLFGPNAAGKSNFLEALQCLSRLVTERTIQDALEPPMRGYPVEAFRLPAGGLKELMTLDEARFRFEADIQPEKHEPTRGHRRKLRYKVEIQTQPRSGALCVKDEYLAVMQLNKDQPRGKAIIEKEKGRDRDVFRVRVRGQGAHPTYEPVGQNHTIVSIPSYAGKRYRHVEALRDELGAWRTYYLDPRVAMRRAQPPSEVTDIGPLGETIAPYLYRLKMEQSRRFAAVSRALRTVIPSVEALDVELNQERGELEITVVQNGVHYPTRIISEGTLRVLALCALCANPWPPALLAFEEPENGVHPRRLDLIARMLTSLAAENGTQVVVTTHSPRFCDAVLAQQRETEQHIELWSVGREGDRSRFRRFKPQGPLFDRREVMDALTSPSEDGFFEALMMRGLIDE